MKLIKKKFNKYLRIRYMLVRKDTDKTFKDSIKSTIEFLRDKNVLLTPVKHLPRKLKKTLKKFNSWEFEIDTNNILWNIQKAKVELFSRGIK